MVLTNPGVMSTPVNIQYSRHNILSQVGRTCLSKSCIPLNTKSSRQTPFLILSLMSSCAFLFALFVGLHDSRLLSGSGSPMDSWLVSCVFVMCMITCIHVNMYIRVRGIDILPEGADWGNVQICALFAL